MSIIQRQSWVWAVLPERAARVESRGDPALAEVLRDSGYESDGAPVDAVLFDTDGVPEPAEVQRAVAALADGGVVSIAVAGGRPEPPASVPAVVRIVQLLASPVETFKALGDARRAERALRGAGLTSRRIATGDRSRRYGLGRGGWLRRLRTPTGFVLTGSRGPSPASLLETAMARAGESVGVGLERRSTTVFESGKVMMAVRSDDGQDLFMRLAAGPAQRPLSASIEAVAGVAGAGPPASVGDRLVVPLAHGWVGPLRYSLEPSAPGSHPWRLTAEVWEDALAFLVELWRLDLSASEVPEALPFAVQAGRMLEYLDTAEREQLAAVVEGLERRLGDLPRGQSHGDFWSENLLVRDGRLATVLDWEWSVRGALPLLDLFDMIALSRRRLRDFTPGERLTEVLLPLARAGGDERTVDYCRRAGVTVDLATIEGLATAYWLDRVSRQLGSLSLVPHRPGWLEGNLHEPLRQLSAAGR